MAEDFRHREGGAATAGSIVPDESSHPKMYLLLILRDLEGKRRLS